MINPFNTETKTGMIVRGAEIISNVGTFALALKNSTKLNAVKSNTEDIKLMSRQNASRVADINDALRYYFPKPQPQPQQPPVQQAPAPVVPVPPVFTQPVVAPQPQPVVVPAANAAMQAQQPVIVAAPQVNTTAEPVAVAAPVQPQPVSQPAPQPAAAPTTPPAEQKQG